MRPSTSHSGLKGDTRTEDPGTAERAIARRSAETRATVPDLEIGMDVDAGAILGSAREQDCSPTAVLVRACATALREFPRANAAYRDGRFELYSRVNIGVVIQTDGGQLTPTVLDADTKSLTELEGELGLQRERARSGELTPPEQAGATFTLSDLGEYGIHRAAPLLTPPQAAALTAGSIRQAPLVRGATVVPGHVLSLTLATDHRILFGARAAAFLARIAELLEQSR